MLTQMLYRIDGIRAIKSDATAEDVRIAKNDVPNECGAFRFALD